MNHILKKTLALAALFCLTLGLAGCQSGAGKTLEQAGTALKNKDSGAFLSQFDMQAYAAHEFANLKQSSQLLSGLDSMGKMLGLGSQVNDLINSIIDLQGRYTDTFTRTVASGELQDQKMESGKTVYETMGEFCEHWGESVMGKYGYSGVGAVVGATYPAQLGEMREKAPHTFFLVPGYGAQGGGADDVAPAFDKNGLGAIINSSRGIMCAWQKEKCDEHDYAQAARREAIRMRDEICARIGEIRANG